MNDWIYDIETYPNVFTMCVEHAESPLRFQFEISDWVNDSKGIIDYLFYLRDTGSRMVGYNNLGFDYPVLHQLVRMGKSDARTLYEKAMAIINCQDNESRFTHMVYPSDRCVEQLDLFKIHHFDNKARSTSLKVLEFNMKMGNLEDLPFKVGSHLTNDQIDTLIEYNWNDVAATKEFYHHSLDKIRFREELSHKYERDFMNHNDTKIGKDYFIMELEKSGVQCYDYQPGKGRQPRQSRRMVIDLNDAILPWIEFDTFEFQRVTDWLRQQKIRETKGVFKGLTAMVNGFEFVFGTGGIHGSIDSEIVESDDEYQVVDLDVSSYYPNVAIVSQFYPEHLGEEFIRINNHLYEMRKKYPKDTAENAMLKLALNGTYGDSNNKFSVFYDPLFTMKTTLNGQLLLCKLSEWLMEIENLSLIQINTDGLTVKVPRKYVKKVREVAAQWETLTGLQLEEADYSIMFVRDCNNYIAVYTNGDVKRKGAYAHETTLDNPKTREVEWHKNHSALVVPKVAEQVLVHGKPIRETVVNWPDDYDFMLRTKVQRTGYLSLGNKQIQNTSRYYVAEGGEKLTKWLPPLKNKKDWRAIGIHTGWGVQVCNDLDDFGKLPIDYEYYIQEVEKLTLGLS